MAILKTNICVLKIGVETLTLTTCFTATVNESIASLCFSWNSHPKWKQSIIIYNASPRYQESTIRNDWFGNTTLPQINAPCIAACFICCKIASDGGGKLSIGSPPLQSIYHLASLTQNAPFVQSSLSSGKTFHTSQQFFVPDLLIWKHCHNLSMIKHQKNCASEKWPSSVPLNLYL